MADMTDAERQDFARAYGVNPAFLPGGAGYAAATDEAQVYAETLSARYGVKIGKAEAQALLDARKAILKEAVTE